VIGGEGSCCASEEKILELEGPLRGRILCNGVDRVVEQAWVRKAAGISWGFHISHSDLTAASRVGGNARLSNQSLSNRRMCPGCGKVAQ
jgi:hypothetical protein